MSNRPTQKTQLHIDVETETYVQNDCAHEAYNPTRINRVCGIFQVLQGVTETLRRARAM